MQTNRKFFLRLWVLWAQGDFSDQGFWIARIPFVSKVMECEEIDRPWVMECDKMAGFRVKECEKIARLWVMECEKMNLLKAKES